jgi:hypothetical protein
MDTENIIDLSNLESSECFTPTMNLRYVIVPVLISGFPKRIPMLEQMWQGSNGTQKWELVEIFEEK